MPDVAESTGGIAMVGRSLMRLFGAKAESGQIAFRAISIRGPLGDPEAAEVRTWVGRRHWHAEGSVARFSWRVVRQLLGWADVAVFTHVGPASLTLFVPRSWRPRTLTWIHGREARRPLPWRKRKALAESHVVVSNTKFTATTARQANPWLGVIRVCHLGIPPHAETLDSNLPWSIEPPPGPRDILVVGRMAAGEPGKGHAALIDAMQFLTARVPEARLIIAGSGSAEADLRRKAANGAAAQQVVFTGYLDRPELEQLYRHAGIFAMPSRQDGFGLVYLEAMRAGLPCIASDADGGQEVVTHEESGFHVPLDDPATLAAALMRLLKDHSLRRRMGQAGRRRFEENFTEERFHTRFWELVTEQFDGTLGDCHPGPGVGATHSQEVLYHGPRVV
jgi:phosphatidylinositol alpha-1,6-mannosyltransferase